MKCDLKRRRRFIKIRFFPFLTFQGTRLFGHIKKMQKIKRFSQSLHESNFDQNESISAHLGSSIVFKQVSKSNLQQRKGEGERKRERERERARFDHPYMQSRHVRTDREFETAHLILLSVLLTACTNERTIERL